MVQTISREKLKAKIDRNDHFVLVETLAKTAYDHAHLPGAINLPPASISSEAPNIIRARTQARRCQAVPKVWFQVVRTERSSDG
jgi:3-mercaptopyruvate sulfurtransferase SseA